MSRVQHLSEIIIIKDLKYSKMITEFFVNLCVCVLFQRITMY